MSKYKKMQQKRKLLKKLFEQPLSSLLSTFNLGIIPRYSYIYHFIFSTFLFHKYSSICTSVTTVYVLRQRCLCGLSGCKGQALRVMQKISTPAIVSCKHFFYHKPVIFQFISRLKRDCSNRYFTSERTLSLGSIFCINLDSLTAYTIDCLETKRPT